MLIDWEHVNYSQTVQKVETECKKLKLNGVQLRGKWRYFNTEFEGERYEQKHLIKHK